MTKNKVSVIIPVYNVEKYIGRCLDSILGQTHREIEIIVVNDCTPDNSMAVVECYAQRDNRIKVVTFEQNRGPMRAREGGIKASEGEYIMFCDSDDWMPLDAVEVLLRAAIEEEADIVSGSFQMATSQNDYSKVRVPKLLYGSDSRSVYKSMLSNEFSHSLWGKIFRAELYTGYDYIIKDNFTNSEDKLLMYQMVEHTNKVVAIDAVVYYYFVNAISSTKDKKKFLQNRTLTNIIFVSNYLYEKFKVDKELLEKYKRNIVNTAISLAASKSVNPKKFINQLALPDRRKLLSISSLLKMYSGKALIKAFIISYYYSIKGQ